MYPRPICPEFSDLTTKSKCPVMINHGLPQPFMELRRSDYRSLITKLEQSFAIIFLVRGSEGMLSYLGQKFQNISARVTISLPIFKLEHVRLVCLPSREMVYVHMTEL